MDTHVLEIFAKVVGCIGVVIVLVAYLLLQADRIDPDQKNYSLMNLVGAIFIVFSLFFEWNTPAMIVECAWVIISFWGLVRAHKPRHRSE